MGGTCRDDGPLKTSTTANTAGLQYRGKRVFALEANKFIENGHNHLSKLRKIPLSMFEHVRY